MRRAWEHGTMGACALLVCVLVFASNASAQGFKDRLKKAAEKAKATAAKVDKAGMKADSFTAKVSVLLPIGTEKEIDIGRGVAATVAGRYPVSKD